MNDTVFDVILIGRGPVGLSMALMMGRLGHKIAIVERHRDLYGLPRAGHIDHEIVRVLQSLGAAAPVLDDSYPTTEYIWKNGLGETLLEFDWGAKGISGYNSDYMQFQPIMEQALSDRARETGAVTEFSGWTALSLVEGAAGVAVTLQRQGPGADAAQAHAGETLVLRGRYLIGADGANSQVRRWIGIEREDLGFNEKWLVVDVRKTADIALAFDCGQICDPARPITVLPLGKRHRRWEWAMLPGETREELERPDTAWRLLADWGVTPDNATIIRQLVYTFEARLAERWRRGRVFLMGDAAHTMPPFMGQGMCSGIRDAKNLAWKLDLVLRGVVDDALLDSYEREREPHTRAWTVISIEAGKVPCTLDPAVAEDRDAKFRAGWLPPMPDFPKLDVGVLARLGDASGAVAGDLSLQAPVEHEGVVKMFDDHFPQDGFSIVSMAGDPRAALDARQIAFLDTLKTTLVTVGAPGTDAQAIDVEGTYAAYFERHGIAAVVNRPDFYVFGAVRRLADLPGLINDLMHQLKPIAAADADAQKVA